MFLRVRLVFLYVFLMEKGIESQIQDGEEALESRGSKNEKS